MAFVLSPRFAPVYQGQQCSPFAFCGPAPRSPYAYRIARPRPQRPQYSSFSHFFTQVDDLLSEIDREAERQAHIEANEAQRAAERQVYLQHQQRERALQASFAVNKIEQGWQVDGQVQGFDQQNISIEVPDDHTLKIAGNTQWQAKKTAQPEGQPAADVPAIEQQPIGEATQDNMDVTTARPSTPDSDTQSHKSYQATVEDDFEDLGAESSSLISSPSRPSSPAQAKEPKGKEKAAEDTVITTQSKPDVQVQQQRQPEPHQEERVHGAFERTFRFPERIDAANISASLKDGVLKVVVPRAQAHKIRRVAIL